MYYTYAYYSADASRLDLHFFLIPKTQCCQGCPSRYRYSSVISYIWHTLTLWIRAYTVKNIHAVFNLGVLVSPQYLTKLAEVHMSCADAREKLFLTTSYQPFTGDVSARTTCDHLKFDTAFSKAMFLNLCHQVGVQWLVLFGQPWVLWAVGRRPERQKRITGWGHGVKCSHLVKN